MLNTCGLCSDVSDSDISGKFKIQKYPHDLITAALVNMFVLTLLLREIIKKETAYLFNLDSKNQSSPSGSLVLTENEYTEFCTLDENYELGLTA